MSCDLVISFKPTTALRKEGSKRPPRRMWKPRGFFSSRDMAGFDGVVMRGEKRGSFGLRPQDDGGTAGESGKARFFSTKRTNP